VPVSPIGEAYDQLADRWLDDRFSQTDGVRQHRQALAFLDAKPGWALNVGCGCNTRFNALMREHGLELEGIDISERMVVLAKIADPTVELYHADVCDWQPPRKYRFITAWDSIWHVGLSGQRPLMLKLMAMLEPGGVFAFTAGGLDESSEHVDSAMGPTLRYATLGIPGLLDAIKAAGCGCRHLEFDQHPQNHLFVIAQRIA
jgi:predicted TPR repeat methyltransferase